MKHHPFSLAALAVLAAACTGTESSTEKLEWGTASLCIEEPIAPGDTLCYHIEYQLDTLAGNGPTAERISQVLRDSVLATPSGLTVGEAMTVAAAGMKAEWQEEIAQMYDPQSDFREMLQYYWRTEGTRVENGTDSILSYQATTDCYLGGAHGSHVVQYYNIRRSDGKLLTIHDIVPKESKKQVLGAMMEQLCKDWGAKDADDLREQTGITALGDLTLSENFILKGDSILFLFNQYEIAPYSAGLISVTIPWPANR